MQLPLIMEKRWLASARLARRTLAIDDEGISLGKTLLAPFREGALVIDESRISALLSAAFGYAIPAAMAESFRHAGRCYKSGNVALAQMHLALCGIQAIDLEKAQRLFVAEWALSNHVSTAQLLKLAGIEKYNRYHLGPGPNGGQFTEASRNGVPLGAGTPVRNEIAPPSRADAKETQVAQLFHIPPVIGVLTEIGEAGGAASEVIKPLTGTVEEIRPTTIEGASPEEIVPPVSPTSAPAEPLPEEPKPTANTDWKLGNFKSAQRWQNQMQDRGWTPEDISDTIKNGEQFPAENNINKGNTAIRYVNPETGKYVVRDEVTKEILQISKEGFLFKDFSKP